MYDLLHTCRKNVLHESVGRFVVDENIPHIIENVSTIC